MNEICVGKISHLTKERSIALPLDVSQRNERNQYFRIRLNNDKGIILNHRVDAFSVFSYKMYTQNILIVNVAQEIL